METAAERILPEIPTGSHGSHTLPVPRPFTPRCLRPHGPNGSTHRSQRPLAKHSIRAQYTSIPVMT